MLVAKALKTKYMSATKVILRSVGVRTQLVPREIGIRPIGDSELVYLQSTPDFCTEDAKMSSLDDATRR